MLLLPRLCCAPGAPVTLAGVGKTREQSWCLSLGCEIGENAEPQRPMFLGWVLQLSSSRARHCAGLLETPGVPLEVPPVLAVDKCVSLLV